MEGTASELQVLHCKHSHLEVILSRTRDVSIDALFIPMINGINGVDTIVLKIDKVVLILELFYVYLADSAMLFNS